MSDLFDPDDFEVVLRSTASAARAGQLPDDEQQFPILLELEQTLAVWRAQQTQANFDPLPTVVRLAEIVEQCMDEFLKQNPDPMDDRHPHRTHPKSAFGNVLKALFRNDDFMNKLIISYILGRDRLELSAAAARLLLDCVPGLDASVIFSTPHDFVPQLFSWAKECEQEELKAYSMGLLGAALEVSDVAANYKHQNQSLISIALARLTSLKDLMETERAETEASEAIRCVEGPGPFANINLEDDHSGSNSMERPVSGGDTSNDGVAIGASSSVTAHLGGSLLPMRMRPKRTNNSIGNGEVSPPRKRRRTLDGESTSKPLKPVPSNASFASLQDLENSSSRWNQVQPFVIGSHKIFPLTHEMHQRLILQFLAPSGEYQDLLGLAYEGHAMDLLMYYIDLEKTRDVRLTYDAIKYLTALLVHRKFALEFVARGGVTALLRVPRACLASVAVVNALYYLSYTEDVMESVCQLPDHVLDNIVEYCLWCQEHSHESGRAGAAMFFSHGLFFRAILDRFDARDGLRIIYNYVSTLVIVQVNMADSETVNRLSEEQLHTSTQAIRNATSAFRSYFMAHLVVKIEQLRRTCKTTILIDPMFASPISPHKWTMLSEESLHAGVQFVLGILRASNTGWRQVEEARRLGLIQLMFKIILYAQDWSQPSQSRNEMARNSLYVLLICSCLPLIQSDFCDPVPPGGDGTNTTGVSLLVDICDASVYDEDVEIQICGLSVVINCVCLSAKLFSRLTDRKDSRRGRPFLHASHYDILSKLWQSLRKHNILMIINDVIRRTSPVTVADRVRTFAARVLLGMSRSEEVRQILSQMPLIANNELITLMAEPVSPDKKHEHAAFCSVANQLIETITMRSVKEKIPNPKDLTQERLWKADVISNTKITYNEKELLQLIYMHLMKKGLNKTASQLNREAELPDVPASRLSNTPSHLKPLPSRLSWKSSPRPQSGMSESVPTPSAFTTPVMSRQRSIDGSPFPRKLLLRPTYTSSRLVPNSQVERGVKPYKELDVIITDFFRAQHALCNKPVATCPPFSLFYPHHCLEPNGTKSVSANIAHRIQQRSTFLPHHLLTSKLLDERLMFSRFAQYRVISDHDEAYTSCAFSIDDEHLIVGMFSGEIHWMNIESGIEESFTACHQSAITSIEPSKDGTMLLTSSAYIRPLSALWSLGETQEHVYNFSDEYFVQFSNLSQDRIIGTCRSKATLYDTETGQLLMKFGMDTMRYHYNRASFSPDDTLVFNDGYLWDIRSPSTIVHDFDKLNITNSGCFHPHGNEVIINTEVWDVRTFRLLRSVPALDQCKLRFNASGDIFYAIVIQEPFDEQQPKNQLSCSFRTFDSSNYSVLATVDAKRPLCDVSCDHSDRFVSIVERQHSPDYLMNREESHVRIFEVGKVRDAEDAEEEEDNADDDDRGDDDESSSSSSLTHSSDGDVFEVLSDMEAGDSDMEDEDDDEDDDRSGSSVTVLRLGSDDEESSSSGWRTDPDGHIDDEEGVNNVEEDEISEDSEVDHEIGEGDDDEDDEDQDESYEPENEHISSSNVALNPHLRRQQKRRDENDGSGGPS